MLIKKKFALFLVFTLVIGILNVFAVAAAEAINIAVGKEYTYTGQCFINGEEQYPDNENKKLTDGVSGFRGDIGYESKIWIGLHLWCPDLHSGVKNEILLDLGSMKSNLSKFVVVGEVCDGGIEEIEAVEVFVSDDNTEFILAGIAIQSKTVDAADYSPDEYGIYAYTVTLSKTVSARYVKFMIKHTVNWAFVSEVEVYQNAVPAAWNVTFDGQYANGIIEGQTISNLTEKLNTFSIKDSKGNPIIGDTLIGTGAVIEVDGKSYTVVVKGDVSGDGRVDSKDYLLVKRAYLGTYSLAEFQLQAACLNGTSAPTAKDYLMIKRHFLGTYSIYS